MIIRHRSSSQFFGLSQLDVPEIAATEAPPAGLGSLTISGYFKLAVGAGVTVWILTKILDGVFFKRKRRQA